MSNAAAGPRPEKNLALPLTFPIILISSMNIDRNARLTGWDTMLQRVGRLLPRWQGRCRPGNADAT
jgi:hypothetical protein